MNIENGKTVRLNKIKGNLKLGKDVTIVAENNTILVDGSVT